MTGNAFASVLNEAVRHEEGRNEQPGRQEALSGQAIAALILQMQQQANDHLFRAMTANDSAEDWAPSLPDRPAYPGHFSADSASPAPGIEGQASKSQHLPQKNDGYSSAGDLDRIIGQAAAAYGVEENLIKSVIRAESNFAVNSTSPRGAMGLMQLMPDTARELGVRNAYDPQENIMGGTKYLKGLLDRYDGDTRLALAAYNWGMGNVERSPGKLPRETRDYITRVTRYYQGAKA
jgi:soluble lytic murein transglycosylase-like protein